MKFIFSKDFTIDTTEEPWRSEGLRVGIFANPGAGKSYTVALLAEQWLDQGGVVVIFQPRAEWHTLKSQYPVQVVGGPFLQDVPLVASEPSLYARVVVEQGVSLVFYTSDVEDEEKLVEFVTHFIARLIKLQEKYHRPLLLIVEESQEYAPRSPSGHIAPPWVYNRMIKALKDCFSQGRKLNICPVAISQRPQEVNFTIRQLANLCWFGGFSAQDVGYLDKEVFTHFRKNGVDVRAQDLLGVDRGEWLVIVGKGTHRVKVTERRKTPHGADTPTLDHIQPVGVEVQKAVSELGSQLKVMLEKRAAEESELEKANRKVKDLEKQVKLLEDRMKTGMDLRALLKGGSDEGVKQELEKMLEEKRALEGKLELETQRSKGLSDRVGVVDAKLTQVEQELSQAMDAVKAYLGLDQAIGNLVKVKVTELLPGMLPKVEIPVQTSGKLVVDQVINDVEVVVHRERVTPDESNLRGQLAILIAEGELDKGLSMRSIGERLRTFGFSAQGLQGELRWYVRNFIIERMSNGYYKVRDKSRVIKREA